MVRYLWICIFTALIVRFLFIFAVLPLLEERWGRNYAATHYDADGYGPIADKILADESMGIERAPLYPAFIAVLYQLYGHSLVAVRLAQILLDVGTVGLIWMIGRRSSPELRPRLWASWLYALYPLAWWRCGFVNKEILQTFVLALFVWLFMEATKPLRRETDSVGRRQVGFLSWGNIVVCGMALGVVNLVKPVYLLLPIALAGWFWQQRRWIAQPGAVFAMFLLGMGLVVVPWTIRNYELTGEFVPVALERGGVTFYVGNYYPARGAWEGPLKSQWQAELQRIAEENPRATEVELDRIYFRAAQANITLPQFLEMFARKAWRFWFANASGRMGQLVLVVQVILVGLGVAGILFRRLESATAIFYCLLIGYLWLVHSVIYADVRFSLPVMPYLMLFAGSLGPSRSTLGPATRGSVHMYHSAIRADFT